MSQQDSFDSLPGMDLFRLDGQLAVITGGSRGLGWAMASGLASAGADVLLVSRNQSYWIKGPSNSRSSMA